MMDKDFEDKRVFISGGTGGIGFAAAKLFAARGATLAVTGRSSERGEAAVNELTALGARQARFFQGNSGSLEEMQRVTSEAAEWMGGINTVVSAGAENRNGLKPFVSMTVDYMRSTFDNLVYPRILPVHAAIPHLQKAGGGSIVMIGTDAARHVTSGESLVGATGAIVITMTKALARELARDKIRVNAVAMTITSGTPGWERAFSSEMSSKVFTKAIERFPYGRPPQASEVAEAMVFLSSDAASQISGQTLSVNGALSFGGW
jgi:2-hydroxycyclohexanecarboxyl-CoA dehydrogenase